MKTRPTRARRAMPAKGAMVAIEEDGDEVFTPIPSVCRVGVSIYAGGKYVSWRECGGVIRPIDGFHKCEKCGGSYGIANAPGVARGGRGET